MYKVKLAVVLPLMLVCTHAKPKVLNTSKGLKHMPFGQLAFVIHFLSACLIIAV